MVLLHVPVIRNVCVGAVLDPNSTVNVDESSLTFSRTIKDRCFLYDVISTPILFERRYKGNVAAGRQSSSSNLAVDLAWPGVCHRDPYGRTYRHSASELSQGCRRTPTPVEIASCPLLISLRGSPAMNQTADSLLQMRTIGRRSSAANCLMTPSITRAGVAMPGEHISLDLMLKSQRWVALCDEHVD